MAEQLRNQIHLTSAQVKELGRATNGGEAHFPEGYRLIHGWIADNKAAQDDGTAFWFEQAAGINSDNSLSANFIRRHTQNGLDLAEVPVSQRRPMQELSNIIAENVIEDVLKDGRVDPLAEILSKDIRVALDLGGVKLGGWGGSFYYWDQPFTNDPSKPFPRDPDGSFHTVGEEIIQRGEKELLLQTSAKTIKDMVVAGEIRLSDALEVLQTNRNASMPELMKAEVTLRAGVMVAEHVRDNVDQNLRQIPDDMQRLLEQQRQNLLDGAKQGLDGLLRPALPSIPNLSMQLTGEDAQRWQQLTAQLDTALERDRTLAQTGPLQSAPTQATTTASPDREVVNLQAGLIQLGYHHRISQPLQANGVNDEATRQAVTAFQAKHDLPISGSVDLATQQTLQQALLAQQLQQQGIDARETGQTRKTEQDSRNDSRDLQPFSDPDHPQHALYANLEQRFQAKGHTLSEEQLSALTGQMHSAGAKPGWQGDVIVHNGQAFAQAAWPPGVRAHLDLQAPAPSVQETMKNLQADQQSMAQTMERLNQQQAMAQEHGHGLSR